MGEKVEHRLKELLGCEGWASSPRSSMGMEVEHHTIKPHGCKEWVSFHFSGYRALT